MVIFIIGKSSYKEFKLCCFWWSLWTKVVSAPQPFVGKILIWLEYAFVLKASEMFFLTYF